MSVTYRLFSSGEVSCSISSCSQSSSVDQPRKAITSFSRQSRTRLRRYLQNSVAKYIVMLTLTYPAQFPTNGRQVKTDLDQFAKQLIRYSLMPESVCWILEFQKRNAPHFHLLLTNLIPKSACSYLWHWASGASIVAGTRIERIRENVTGYALKYAGKMDQKNVPPGFESVGRFWGVWGMRDVNPVVEATIDLQTHELDRFNAGLAEKAFLQAGYNVFQHPQGFLAFKGPEK